MKGKLTAILLILFFILIAAIVFLVLSNLDLRSQNVPTSPEPAQEVVVITAEPTLPPAPQTPAPTPAPTPLPTPVPTPVPAPVTPAPAPVTTPYAVPTQTMLASGSFRSETGSYLNLVADWDARVLDADRVQITVTLSAESYALRTSALVKTLNLSVDGQYVSLDAPAITYEGSALAKNLLGTQSFTVQLPQNSSKAVSLQAEWHFNGSYGGPNGVQELLSIECGGTINLAR